MSGPADAPRRGSGRGQPLFVERQTYRRRRLVDACRALPVLGLMLWLLPLLWSIGDTPTRASQALIFVFAVWVALPISAFALNTAIRRFSDRPYGEEGP